MQVEDVAGVGFASRGTTQRKRHLTVGDSLLGQVVVHDQNVAAGVGGAGGTAVLAVVHEVLADGGACHRRNVLQRGRIGSGGGHDDRVLERTVCGEHLSNRGDRRGLLANGDVHADHALCHAG